AGSRQAGAAVPGHRKLLERISISIDLGASALRLRVQRFGTQTMLDRISAKVREGVRLNPEEGLFLLRDADLMSLGQLAQWVRHQKHPGNRVTFIVDSNPNYTNVCVADCLFC